jgi:hypothetical protein
VAAGQRRAARSGDRHEAHAAGHRAQEYVEVAVARQLPHRGAVGAERCHRRRLAVAQRVG